jgi:uncharacterized protein (UPF0210 family)
MRKIANKKREYTLRDAKRALEQEHEKCVDRMRAAIGTAAWRVTRCGEAVARESAVGGELCYLNVRLAELRIAKAVASAAEKAAAKEAGFETWAAMEAADLPRKE